MRPGDIAVCTECGARSEPAHSTGGRKVEEGGALIITWLNGAFPRHDAARDAPVRCLWCDDRRIGFPELVPGFEAIAPATRPDGEGPLNAEQENVRKTIGRGLALDGTKAPLDPLSFPCEECRVPAGERCKNYHRQNKATCPSRGKTAAPPPAPAQTTTVPVQLGLFG
jgi:hypothetical protein